VALRGSRGGPNRSEGMATRAASVPRARKLQAPLPAWIVVGLTEDGEELKRITVVEPRLREAIDMFASFADWVQVVDPTGKERPRTAWTRWVE
jgi:hypothetical protein